jgi:glutathione S-transferase
LFNVQKVLWLVGELELAHEHIDAGGTFGGLDTPKFLATNPHGRMPVIQNGDAIVWESRWNAGTARCSNAQRLPSTS